MGVNVFAADGQLAQTIPHFEDRAAQRQMAQAVADALRDRATLLVEAGTGTGKSLGYLVPALQSGLRVVVSTSTHTLQDQLVEQELPLAQLLVAEPVRATVLKGLSSYVCRRRLAAADIPESVAAWSRRTTTGDARDFAQWLGGDAGAPNAPDVWSRISASSDTRVGPRCQYFSNCFVTRARLEAERAQLIVVNHHLYVADLQLRQRGTDAAILPDHDAVIIDEAHTFGDILTELTSVRVGRDRLTRFLAELRHAMPESAIAAVAERAERQFAALIGALRRGSESTARADRNEARFRLYAEHWHAGAAQTAWFDFDNTLAELEASSNSDDDSASAVAFRTSRALRDDLATLAETPKDCVTWLDATTDTLVASPVFPLEAMRRLRGQTLSTESSQPPRAVIFTSGTLTSAGEFAFCRRQLGLPQADGEALRELRIDSPFDYATQALLYIPRDVTPADTLSPAALAHIASLLPLFAGRAFLLFTSHRALTDAAARLRHLPYNFLVQGTASRTELIARFRTMDRAVLLGTGTFWEGVDVPGSALSLVVIDRLPFEVPTDPLLVARLETLAANDVDGFWNLQLPAAALTLRQGFGRLIRRRDDRGVVAVLDSRLVARRYGAAFLATLPKDLPRTSAFEQVRRWVAGDANSTT